MSEKYQTLCSALSYDLVKLDTLKFPRFVTNEDGPADSYIFCDPIYQPLRSGRI